MEAQRQLEAAAAREKPPAAALHEGKPLPDVLRLGEDDDDESDDEDYAEVDLEVAAPSTVHESHAGDQDAHHRQQWEGDSQGGVDPTMLDDIGREPPPPIARELLPNRGLSTQSNRSSDSSESPFQLRPAAKRSGTQRPKPLVLQRRDDDFDF